MKAFACTAVLVLAAITLAAAQHYRHCGMFIDALRCDVSCRVGVLLLSRV
jgi:hypothetical protein